ncbi:hypothetical protein HDV05_002606, partial [Chytridiales sp. JEL 0842]
KPRKGDRVFKLEELMDPIPDVKSLERRAREAREPIFGGSFGAMGAQGGIIPKTVLAPTPPPPPPAHTKEPHRMKKVKRELKFVD